MMKLACILALCVATRAFYAPSSKLIAFNSSPSWKPLPAGSSLRHASNAVSSLSNLNTLRGGSLSLDALSARLSTYAKTTPTNFFNALFIALGGFIMLFKLIDRHLISKDEGTSSGSSKDAKPEAMKSLQLRFLGVFWLLRMADWLQGPYFYQVYSEKIINGAPATMDTVSKLFLAGFASTGLFGPYIGSLVDKIGRKTGTIAFCIAYIFGAVSTTSSLLPILFLGRFFNGFGTSLLFSAPEAWLVGEHIKEKQDPKWLGQTFGWAFAGDSLIAIAAGQLASYTASKRGAAGPFTASVPILVTAALLTSIFWKENVATSGTATETSAPTEGKKKDGKNAMESVGEAWNLMLKDKKILLVGGMQSLFEGAMYIFVMQWAPAIAKALETVAWTRVDSTVPYGKIFSCFMASCLCGSTLFNALQERGKRTESILAGMMTVATLAMFSVVSALKTLGTTGTFLGVNSMTAMVIAFFIFEACVGMYFPSIGTLRSKYLPDSHRSVMINLFGLPLNLIVVSVFLSIKKLGLTGAFASSTLALTAAATCATTLRLSLNKKE
jgi:hypothetical protein